MTEQLLALDLRQEVSGQPKHERLKNHLVNEIIAGRLSPGQALPSERQFMQALGVARMTICQALGSMESDGLIRRVQGKGTFVDDDVRQKLKRGLDMFALLVPETREGFYPSLLHGFEEAASEIHHQAIICRTDDDVDKQASIVLQLIDKKVGGVVFNPTTPTPTPVYQVRQLRERGIPVVFCHHRVEGISAPVLAIPFREVGRLAGQTLTAQGHRRIAFLTSVGMTPSISAIEQGLRETMVDGATMTAHRFVERPLLEREESCWAELQKVFSQPDPPTAIFASFDPLAELIYILLLRMGKRIPDDVALLGFGGKSRESALTRELSSIVVDEDATGREVVSLLHEMRLGIRPIDDNTETVMKLELSNGRTLRSIA
jgi:GntR family transcriptional regulator of arabinose operon